MKALTKQPNLFILFLTLLSVKFFVVRIILFDSYNFLKSSWVELGYVILLLALVELFVRKGKFTVYLLINIIVSVLFFSIIIYFDFFGIIVTYHALSQLNQVGAVSDSIWTLISPVQFLFFADILIVGFLAVMKKLPFSTNVKNRKVVILLVVFSLVNIFYNVFDIKGTGRLDSVTAAERYGIVNFELKEIYLDYRTDNPIDFTFTLEEIKALKEISEPPIEERNYFGVAEDRNIIVIQFESIQNFTIGLEIDGQEITPNLNKLVAEGLYFPKFFQQIGIGNTSDAEFMLNTALYPPGMRGASEVYGDRMIPSLPRLLKNDGYKSVTFHTNTVTFWKRDEMYPALGFDQYYDEEFFGTEDYFLMGASDEVLYDKTFDVLKELHETGQKYYANVITMTSHHPFTLPEDKLFIELPNRFQDTFINDYLTSIHYADKVLGDFIDNLKEAGMWDESLIVIYGDHSGVHHANITDEDKSLLNELIGREYWFVDRFNIPLVITAPGIEESEMVENVGGQIDLMPTITNLLGIEMKNQIYFGQDILNHNTNLLGMRYYLGIGSFFNSEVLATPESEGGTAYDLNTGEVVGKRAEYPDDFNRVLKLLEWSDSYGNTLPNR